MVCEGDDELSKKLHELLLNYIQSAGLNSVAEYTTPQIQALASAMALRTTARIATENHRLIWWTRVMALATIALAIATTVMAYATFRLASKA